MSIRKKLNAGFTLIELMIVVAIVGVLAVLAVYGVRKYIANAKTAEAKNSLGQMGKDAVTAYESERMDAKLLAEGGTTGILRTVCGSSTATIPATASLVSGQKYQSSKLDWSQAADIGAGGSAPKGFPCLKYEMTAPQYFVYDYKQGATAGAAGTGVTSPATGFAAAANADLSNDTKFSTFGVTGDIVNGRLLVSPSISEDSPEE